MSDQHEARDAATNVAQADYIQAFMHRQAPDFSKAALVIVDMQYATGSREGALARRVLATPEGRESFSYRFDRIEQFVLPNTKRLLDAFRAKGGHVVFVKVGAQHADASDAPLHMRRFFVEMKNHVGSREHEIVEELAPRPGESIVTKTTNGAFASSGIDSVLRALDAQQLYLTGVSTNMCVETTGREAADRGYVVTLVDDACGSTFADLHAGTMRNFSRLFGRVASTAEVLKEIEISINSNSI